MPDQMTFPGRLRRLGMHGNPLGAVWRLLKAEEQERIMTDQAETARLLKELIQLPHWLTAFYPVLCRLHDEDLEAVKAKRLPPEVLTVYDRILRAVDGKIQIGEGAFARLSERRARSAEIYARMKEETPMTG